jgi:hypothetical protein
MITYRIVGDDDAKLDTAVMPQGENRWQVVVSRGYGKPPQHPVLEAVRGERVLRRAPLHDLPTEARLLPLVTKDDPRIRLTTFMSPFPFGSPVVLTASLTRAPKPNEIAMVDVTRTTYQSAMPPMPFLTEAYFDGIGQAMVWISNADKVDAADLHISRYKLDPIDETVTLKGAALVFANGKPGFRVSGVSVTLPVQYTIPDKPTAHRNLVADLIIRMAAPAVRRGMPFTQPMRYTLVSPRPESLGLTMIRSAGVTSDKYVSPKVPLKLGPVDLTIRIQRVVFNLVETFEARVPVHHSKDKARLAMAGGPMFVGGPRPRP